MLVLNVVKFLWCSSLRTESFFVCSLSAHPHGTPLELTHSTIELTHSTIELTHSTIELTHSTIELNCSLYVCPVGRFNVSLVHKMRSFSCKVVMRETGLSICVCVFLSKTSACAGTRELTE